MGICRGHCLVLQEKNNATTATKDASAATEGAEEGTPRQSPKNASSASMPPAEPGPDDTERAVLEALAAAPTTDGGLVYWTAWHEQLGKRGIEILPACRALRELARMGLVEQVRTNKNAQGSLPRMTKNGRLCLEVVA